ncbi:hypothetical protein A2973_04875 [Candidatus Gottesmanbacteria bacterium RIFCSPLOWO2_01_FULL_49_10]|uniref:Membrane protein 6-pyruvoyl-tetrahydropterin synthase-related domain-containing protein n=1 Tax=Candidatus Gottesmanbacteria bacterium RIFCSPLOWO2_01_FULL_49_10 TaxID=1798396 RepID=A0A1F6AXK5_9BACT|nr:MAG: hypothetical protein A2973_04875 [Candidatus Gottesmanbacteria bacterium RIFCSPLOWO2_01_FULL_49_10]
MTGRTEWVKNGIVFLSISGFVALLFSPLTHGLVLLPLDLLVSRYGPWFSAGTILLKNSYMQDSVIQMYPWKQFVWASLRSGFLPFWNPYQLMGMPFLAGLKPMVFYPITWFGLLGDIPGWNILLVSQVFLSFFFAYLFGRTFAMSRVASILVALAFSMNSLMVGVLQFGSEGHVLLWLPFLFVCVKKFIDRDNAWYLLGLSLGVGLSIFAGQLQYTAYMLLLVGSFVLYDGYHEHVPFTWYVWIGGSMLLGVTLTAVQLGPAVELFAHSFRGIVSDPSIYTRGLMAPYSLLRLFAPDLFGNPVTGDLTIGYIETSGYFGVLPVLFALWALGNRRKLPPVAIFFCGSFLVAILLSLRVIGELVVFFHVPVITSGSAERIFSIVHFSGAVLAGYGLDYLLGRKDYAGRRRFLLWCSLFFGAFLLLSVAFHRAIGAGSLWAMLWNIRYTVVVVGAFIIGSFVVGLMHNRIRRLAPVILSLFVIILTYGDLYRMAYRFLTFSNTKFLYPRIGVIDYVEKATRTTLSRVYGMTEPEIPTILGLYTAETYNPLYLGRSGYFLNALLGKQSEELPVNKYLLAPGNRRLKYALDVLGVSTIVIESIQNASSSYFGTEEFAANLTPVYKDEKYSVYTNVDAHPRFGLYYAAEVKADEGQVLDAILSRKVDLTRTLLLEERLPFDTHVGTGSAQLVGSSPNGQRFAVTSDTPAALYVSDTFFPGWKATVDGTKTPILRANYLFRAVVVPQGTSLVEFTYEPTHWKLWVAVSVASCILILFLPVGFGRRRKNTH